VTTQPACGATDVRSQLSEELAQTRQVIPN
jgi:hypothetical protein